MRTLRPSRRSFLGGVIGGVIGGSCSPRGQAPLVGGIVGRADAERGHATFGGPVVPGGIVDVAIVGAGIGGLSAAWRLARAGFRGTVGIYELGDAPGGTSQGGRGSSGGPGFPWGAHYVTLPNPGAVHYRAILADLGVITSFDTDWRFDTAQSRRMVDQLEQHCVQVDLEELASPFGHDSFLLQPPGYHERVTKFLA